MQSGSPCNIRNTYCMSRDKNLNKLVGRAHISHTRGDFIAPLLHACVVERGRIEASWLPSCGPPRPTFLRPPEATWEGKFSAAAEERKAYSPSVNIYYSQFLAAIRRSSGFMNLLTSCLRLSCTGGLYESIKGWMAAKNVIERREKRLDALLNGRLPAAGILSMPCCQSMPRPAVESTPHRRLEKSEA